jgi:hypothetical protein
MMLATNYEEDNPEKSILGNLARELVQFYHGLARNDRDFPQTPSELLTGRNGTVYVNRHIAVVVEAVSAKTPDHKPPRPYQTLLFPQASPSELLESLSNAAVSRQLQQLLLTMNPQKTLREIAAEANLPLQTVLDMSADLVRQGVCRVSPTLTRQSYLACQSINSIHDASLAFAQAFGPINLFVLVAFITEPGRTLGDAMTLLGSTDGANESTVQLLRQGLLDSPKPLKKVPSNNTLESDTTCESEEDANDDTEISDDHHHDELRRISGLVYQMAVWLCSRGVTSHLFEFLVHTKEGIYGRPVETGEKKTDNRLDSNDETIFNELYERGIMDGTTSLQSCSWQIGLDYGRLRAFALRHEQVRIVTRLAIEGDDL